MKLTLSLAALLSLASATAVNVEKRDSPIVVKLEAVGNTQVKATVTNTGATAYNLLNKGTILDTAHTEKLQVFQGENKVAFEGIRQRLLFSNMAPELFTAINAGESIEVTVDMAQLHDLTTGGAYDVVANGAIPYAEVGSTELSGKALTFASNVLNVNVDGAQAAKIPRAFEKRTRLGTDCTGTKLTAVRTALSNCVSFANAAATAATSGSASKFSEYFKTASKTTVAARLRAVASDCGSTTSGATQTHCTDTQGGCSSNVLAYTIPSQNYIVYCNLFFSALPAVSNTCHAQDQATTVLHEETHAPAVYSPGTQDNGYGYAAATALSANAALNNADSYALYSNAIHVGC